MPDLEKIRFLTVNYSRLQGLKAVPSGLLLFLTVLWVNAQTDRPENFGLPLTAFFAAVVLYILIDRYYRKTYGSVEPAGHAHGMEWILAAGFAVLAVGAFIVDMRQWIPVSVFALIFALGLLVDYLRMIRLAGSRTAVLFPAGWLSITLMAASAFLPLLGESALGAFGFRSALLLVYAVCGVITMVYGAAGHFYLVRFLDGDGEKE
ncbi:MAG: hypothetical protein ACK2UB_10270 [Anaerolineales bacterium]